MTVQALQQNQIRPISVVPVYVGYEHVLEVDTYAKELRGRQRKKTPVWSCVLSANYAI